MTAGKLVEYRKIKWICGCEFVGRKQNVTKLDRVEKCRTLDGTVFLGVFNKCEHTFKRVLDGVILPCKDVEVAILDKDEKK